jgi:hypothetical protein
MDNIEIKKGIFQADIRKGVRIHIQIRYEISLEDFLEVNYLADEVYYINLINKQLDEEIIILEEIVNFQDISKGDKVLDDIADQWYDEKITRDHYWYYKEYQSFLKERLQELIQPQQPEPESLDLSDSSAVEKIIYLNELGIIDFLRTKPEFVGSTNLMATFLSAITGEKVLTLQPSLNRLINNDTADKNHPYRTQKTVNKVRQTLIDKNVKPKAS